MQSRYSAGEFNVTLPHENMQHIRVKPNAISADTTKVRVVSPKESLFEKETHHREKSP